MRKPLFTMAVSLLLVLFVAIPGVARGYLSDLAGHWSAGLVSALEARGVISGDPQGRFMPEAPLTRAQMAKLFAVGLGYEAEALELQKHPSRYTDLPSRHWARGYVEVVTELGIAEGYPGGQFRPDEPVTRSQLALFLVRATGLTDRARLARLEPTPYKDDSQIPSWARGAVFVARAEGLMTGTPEGFFNPNQPVSRAEGSATIFRLLARNGSLYHLSGTLVRYDPVQRSGTVRDALGQERPFTMEPDATYLRQGSPAGPDQVRPLDQVFVVLNEQGRGSFLEARYQDLLVERARFENGGLSLMLPSGERLFRQVQPGALIFLNGRQVRLDSLPDSGPVYLLLDQITGEVRLVDAVDAPTEGIFVGLQADGTQVGVLVDNSHRSYEAAPDLVVISGGQRTGLSDLVIGDPVRVAVDEKGRLTYIEVTR